MQVRMRRSMVRQGQPGELVELLQPETPNRHALPLSLFSSSLLTNLVPTPCDLDLLPVAPHILQGENTRQGRNHQRHICGGRDFHWPPVFVWGHRSVGSSLMGNHMDPVEDRRRHHIGNTLSITGVANSFDGNTVGNRGDRHLNAWPRVCYRRRSISHVLILPCHGYRTNRSWCLRGI